MATQLSDTDRLGFTVFLALVVHAVVVLGITFAPEEPAPSSRTMDVTLAQSASAEAPEEADFIADADQIGSGDLEDPEELTATEDAPLSDPEIREVDPLPQTPSQPETMESIEDDPVIDTLSETRQQVPATDPSDERPEAARDETPEAMARSDQIASLQARLDDQRQAYANRPRTTTVTAASTMRSENAWYVQNWQQRVEEVGNRNYPDEARRDGIHGQVRMLVAINQDGSVREVSVLQSSGHRILDEAAKRTVREASPFAPFTDAMREEQDVLEVIRTWSFQRRGLTAG